MNSKNSGTCDTHRKFLNFKNKIRLKRGDKYFSLSKLSIYYTWKNKKKSYKNSKFKIIQITASAWNKEFNYLMDHILYQIFKTNLSIS